MRTTLTLEEDVAKGLTELGRHRGSSFKSVVNEALRAGLAVLLRRPKTRSTGRYRTRPVSLGRPRLPSLDDIAGVLALSEGEGHR